MPVHPVKGGGFQWGGKGKVYHGPKAQARAAAQGRAAYANGYRGHDMPQVKPKFMRPRGRG